MTNKELIIVIDSMLYYIFRAIEKQIIIDLRGAYLFDDAITDKYKDFPYWLDSRGNFKSVRNSKNDNWWPFEKEDNKFLDAIGRFIFTKYCIAWYVPRIAFLQDWKNDLTKEDKV